MVYVDFWYPINYFECIIYSFPIYHDAYSINSSANSSDMYHVIYRSSQKDFPLTLKRSTIAIDNGCFLSGRFDILFTEKDDGMRPQLTSM